MYKEPAIRINGVLLSEGQAMALRTVCSNFIAEEPDPDALGADETGRALASAYHKRMQEVVALMFSHLPA